MGAVARKTAAIARLWPRWCALLILGKRWEVISELRALDHSIDSNRRDAAYSGDSDTLAEELPEGHINLERARTDVTVILLGIAALLLGARRLVHREFVDGFVSLGVVMTAAAVSASFLFGITGLRWSRGRSADATAADRSLLSKIGHVARDAFVFGCFLTSTIPFTLPWLLGFFFPFELLLFATPTMLLIETFSRVSRLFCRPGDAAHRVHSHRHARPPSPLPGAEPEPQPAGADARERVPSSDKRVPSSGTRVPRPEKEAVAPEASPALVDAAARAVKTIGATGTADWPLPDKERLVRYLLSEPGREWCAAFLGIESGLVLLASALSLVWETALVSFVVPGDAGDQSDGVLWETHFGVILAGVISTSTFLQAFWISYAAGGRWLHFDKGWGFFQPFRGGSAFVALQVVAWAFYALCLSLSASRLAPVIMGALASEQFGLQLAPWTVRTAQQVFSMMGSLARATGVHALPPGTVGFMYVLAHMLLLLSLTRYQSALLGDPVAPPQLRREDSLAELLTPADQVRAEADAQQPPGEGRRRELSRSASSLRLAKREPLPGEGDRFRIIVHADQLGVAAESLVDSRERARGWLVASVDDAVRTVAISVLVFMSVKPEVVLGIIAVICIHALGDATRAPLAIAALVVIYLPSYLGRPSLTGAREVLRGAAAVYAVIEDHFRLRTVRATQEPWDASDRSEYIIGYHPHGLLPGGAMYAKKTAQWKALFPGIRPMTLSATITHQVPILRDVAQWSGGLEVSKKGFWAGLNRFRAVMLVPGGQHEMLLRPESAPDNTDDDDDDGVDDVVQEMISTKHKGFIRLALRRAAARASTTVHLVPIFAFGDRKVIRNLPGMPMWLQKWFVHRLRTNVAFFPVGRFGLPSVPERGPISIVVGAPIPVPALALRRADRDVLEPSEAQVDLLHRRYFSALKDLFDAYKGVHGHGYEAAHMTFEPPLAPLREEQFARAWERARGGETMLGDAAAARFAEEVDEERYVWPWQEQLVTLFATTVFMLGPVLLHMSV